MEKLKLLYNKLPAAYKTSLGWLIKYGAAAYLGMQYGPAAKKAYECFLASIVAR